MSALFLKIASNFRDACSDDRLYLASREIKVFKFLGSCTVTESFYISIPWVLDNWSIFEFQLFIHLNTWILNPVEPEIEKNHNWNRNPLRGSVSEAREKFHLVSLDFHCNERIEPDLRAGEVNDSPSRLIVRSESRMHSVSLALIH